VRETAAGLAGLGVGKGATVARIVDVADASVPPR
jgi:hypothetical protein